jgi:hypothetical protein
MSARRVGTGRLLSPVSRLGSRDVFGDNAGAAHYAPEPDLSGSSEANLHIWAGLAAGRGGMKIGLYTRNRTSLHSHYFPVSCPRRLPGAGENRLCT